MWWLLISLLLFSVSCERRTEVKLEGGNPPSFVLSGSGNLVEFSVGVVNQDKTLPPSKRSQIMWKVVPNTRDGERVEMIRHVVYGKLPDGYRQTLPPNAEFPPPLIEGKYYWYYFETINAPHASGYFEIKDGKPVPVYGVGTCYKIVNGQEIESPCDDSSNNRNSTQ